MNPDQILTQKHVRVFTQDGGPLPIEPPRLSGVDNQFLSVGGLTVPVRGSIDRIRVHDPAVPGRYKTVGASETAADFPTFSLMVRERHGNMPKALTGDVCPFNLYLNAGKCTNLSDFLGGWTDYVFILSQCEVSNVDGGDRTSWDGDDPIEDSLDCTAIGGAYMVGALSFGETGGATVDINVIEAVYADSETCANCGPSNDGTKWRYGVTAFTELVPAQLVYSTDYGATWTAANISGIGDVDPTAVRVIGNNLVVFSKLGGNGTTLSGHFIIALNKKTGVPTGTWSTVTTGYVATFTINDVYVANPREIYLCADDGYIYFTDNITAGVSVLNAGAATAVDLLRIAGDGDTTVVAAGATGVVVKSLNRGVTWAAVAAVPVVASLTALEVLSADQYWVGAAAIYNTQDGGETWATKAIASTGSGVIHDIKFATAEVGYIASVTSGVAKIISTWNGGYSWTQSANRILNMITASLFHRVAYPTTSNQTVRANNVMAAGEITAAGDGIILAGAANLL